jgi:hypothetical protein
MDPTPKMSLLIIYTCSERKQKRLQWQTIYQLGISARGSPATRASRMPILMPSWFSDPRAPRSSVGAICQKWNRSKLHVGLHGQRMHDPSFFGYLRDVEWRNGRGDANPKPCQDASQYHAFKATWVGTAPTMPTLSPQNLVHQDSCFFWVTSFLSPLVISHLFHYREYHGFLWGNITFLEYAENICQGVHMWLDWNILHTGDRSTFVPHEAVTSRRSGCTQHRMKFFHFFLNTEKTMAFFEVIRADSHSLTWGEDPGTEALHWAGESCAGLFCLLVHRLWMTLLQPRLTWNSPPILHQNHHSINTSMDMIHLNNSYSRAWRWKYLGEWHRHQSQARLQCAPKSRWPLCSSPVTLPSVTHFQKLPDCWTPRNQHKRDILQTRTGALPKVVAKHERRQACRAHEGQNAISSWRPRPSHSQHSSSARIPQSVLKFPRSSIIATTKNIYISLKK